MYRKFKLRLEYRVVQDLRQGGRWGYEANRNIYSEGRVDIIICIASYKLLIIYTKCTFEIYRLSAEYIITFKRNMRALAITHDEHIARWLHPPGYSDSRPLFRQPSLSNHRSNGRK
jgi:hypothetical protein